MTSFVFSNVVPHLAGGLYIEYPVVLHMVQPTLFLPWPVKRGAARAPLESHLIFVWRIR